MEYPKFKVSVRCFTFNHSKYITDAMNGFVMQQTDFPYVCCIVDDASKDGEQDVIRKYVSDNFDLSEGSCHFERETDYAFITYAQHKSNKNCYFAVLYLKENHYSIKKPKMPYLAEWQDGCEYHALCEGDDYWIHPGKLQMQAEFLDGHEDYSMCFHKAKIISDNDNVKRDSIRFRTYDSLETRTYYGTELAKSWKVPTASILYKSKIKAPVDKRFIYGDQKLVLQCALEGNVYCFGDIMSVYRLINNGASFNRTNDIDKSINHVLALKEYFGNSFDGNYNYKISAVLVSRFLAGNKLKTFKFLLLHPYYFPRFLLTLFRSIAKSIFEKMNKKF